MSRKAKATRGAAHHAANATISPVTIKGHIHLRHSGNGPRWWVAVVDRERRTVFEGVVEVNESIDLERSPRVNNRKCARPYEITRSHVYSNGVSHDEEE